MSTLTVSRLPGALPDDDWKNGVGEEVVQIGLRLESARRHLTQPVSRQPVEELFAELAMTWKSETAYSSSVSEIVAHPAYQRIIGLGPAVVPLILQSLRVFPDHWFAALVALTGADPVPDSQRGKLVEMAETWVRWGQERRLTP